MYADDTSIYVFASNIDDLNMLLNEDLEQVGKWFKYNRMVMNVSKTNCMLVCNKQKRYRLTSNALDVKISDMQVTNVESQKLLGVTFDNNLKFDTQVDNVCNKLSKLSYLFRQIKDYLTVDAKHTYYNAYFLPCLDYCVTTWGYCSKMNMEKIYMYQKRLGRMLLNDYECSTKVLFNRLGWLTVYERIELQTLKLVYKCLYDTVPIALSNMLSLRCNDRDLPLRNTGIDLSLPKAKTECRKCSFDYKGAEAWNNLPMYVKQSESMTQFKFSVKTYIKSKRES
jgi:hypothetical protein